MVAGSPPMFIKSGIDGGPWGGTRYQHPRHETERVAEVV